MWPCSLASRKPQSELRAVSFRRSSAEEEHGKSTWYLRHRMNEDILGAVLDLVLSHWWCFLPLETSFQIAGRQFSDDQALKKITCHRPVTDALGRHRYGVRCALVRGLDALMLTVYVVVKNRKIRCSVVFSDGWALRTKRCHKAATNALRDVPSVRLIERLCRLLVVQTRLCKLSSKYQIFTMNLQFSSAWALRKEMPGSDAPNVLRCTGYGLDWALVSTSESVVPAVYIIVKNIILKNWKILFIGLSADEGGVRSSCY
jgi:hypothetical protein